MCIGVAPWILKFSGHFHASVRTWYFMSYVKCKNCDSCRKLSCPKLSNCKFEYSNAQFSAQFLFVYHTMRSRCGSQIRYMDSSAPYLLTKLRTLAILPRSKLWGSKYIVKPIAGLTPLYGSFPPKSAGLNMAILPADNTVKIFDIHLFFPKIVGSQVPQLLHIPDEQEHRHR